MGKQRRKRKKQKQRRVPTPPKAVTVAKSVDEEAEVEEWLHEQFMAKGGYEMPKDKAVELEGSIESLLESLAIAVPPEGRKSTKHPALRLPAPMRRLTHNDHISRVASVVKLISAKAKTGLMTYADGQVGSVCMAEFFSRGENRLTYYRREVRLVPPTPSNFWKEVERRVHKKWHSGEYVREYLILCAIIGLELSGYIVLSGFLKKGDTILFRNHDLYNSVLQEAGKPEFSNLHFFIQKDLDIVVTMMHAFSISDAPCWMTMSEDLALLLTRTEVKGVKPDEARFPHPVFLLEVPPETFWHGNGDLRAVVAVRECVVLPDKGTVENLSAHYVYRVPVQSGAPKGTYTYASTFWRVDIHADEDLADSWSRVWAQAASGDPSVNLDEAEFRVFEKKVRSKEFFKSIFDLLINSILYLNSPSADVKEQVRRPRKDTKRSAALEPLSRCDQLLVGTKINLDFKVRQTLREGRRPSRGGKITYSFVVKGHWRNQAYGPKRSLRKRIWIEPFVKGGDLGTRIIGHTYNDG